MKNSILSLGKTLNKTEQKNIYGGIGSVSVQNCNTSEQCNSGYYCDCGKCISKYDPVIACF